MLHYNSADARALLEKELDQYPDMREEVAADAQKWDVITLIEYHGAGPMISHAYRELLHIVLDGDLGRPAWKAALSLAFRHLTDTGEKTGKEQLIRNARATAAAKFLRTARPIIVKLPERVLHDVFMDV